MFYDIIMCRFTLKWPYSKYFYVKETEHEWDTYRKYVIFSEMWNFKQEPSVCCTSFLMWGWGIFHRDLDGLWPLKLNIMQLDLSFSSVAHHIFIFFFGYWIHWNKVREQLRNMLPFWIKQFIHFCQIRPLIKTSITWLNSIKLISTRNHGENINKKSKPCRYKFVRFFTDITIVAVPLGQSVDMLEESKTLTKRHNILLKVKKYIDEFLDLSNTSYVDNLTVSEALIFLNIAEADYYHALSRSPTSDYEIH